MKKNKTIVIILLVVALLIGVLCYVSSHPFVSSKCEISEEYVSEIYAQTMGTYSNRIPLLPVVISIENLSGERAYYTIHYFPFGTVEMSYSPTDGFNQEKALSGLQ